ncbi:MAG: ATP-binding protein [Pseudohongiellaceae bacterium]
MFNRHITSELRRLLTEYPVVTLLGARQVGKTTLAQSFLDGWNYCNLEDPQTRRLAGEDPQALLADFSGPTIIDEIQRVPELLSYIQVEVDAQRLNGRFVLTGSHQLMLREAITQSLAGRTAILQLHPFSIAELREEGITFATPYEYIYRGFLPRIYDQAQRPTQAWSNYYRTYVERDVRQLVNLKDATLFENFMKLLAGRAGQIMDYTSLANDTGVSATTIKQWLSILEVSFVIYKLPSYYNNFGKRVVKAPKYYFMDTGLLAYLLGIEQAEQIGRDPLMGQMFENLVIMECVKSLANQGKHPTLYFFRDSNGTEIDVLFETGRQLVAIEIKASMTYRSTLLAGVNRLRTIAPHLGKAYLVYAGKPFRFSDGTSAIRYDQVEQVFEGSYKNT